MSSTGGVGGAGRPAPVGPSTSQPTTPATPATPAPAPAPAATATSGTSRTAAAAHAADPAASILSAAARSTTGGLQSTALKGDATLEAVARGERTIAQGARGDSVKKLQQALMAAGYPLPRYGADGGYGNEGMTAVKALQRDAGLPQTGTVDAATIRALDRKLPGGAPPAPTGLTNARFSGDSTLAAVAAGRSTLGTGSRGEGVKAVQQALMDLGFDLPRYGADGSLGNEAKYALQRFQQEKGIPKTGKIDKATLTALDRAAPPPGKKLETFPEYDKLYADGRLDTTIAIGFDEHGTTDLTLRTTLNGLTSQGYRRVYPERMSAAERTKLGVGPDRFEAGASYYHRKFNDPATGRPVEAVVKVITPDSASKPEDVAAMFKRSIERDEVVLYGGHARYGTGPDFDHIDSGRGNFVIDRSGNKRADRDRPPGHMLDHIEPGRTTDLDELSGRPAGGYQLLFFNACSTEEYNHNLRDTGAFAGRDRGNTDVVGSTIPTRLGTNGDHLVRFMQGITARESMTSINRAQSSIEVAYLERLRDQGATGEDWNKLIPTARYTYSESGFLDNAGNKFN